MIAEYRRRFNSLQAPPRVARCHVTAAVAVYA
jgi:hypothetical protein